MNSFTRNKKSKRIDAVNYAFAIFSIITGSMIYMSLFLIFDSGYVVRGSVDFVEDVILLVVSLFVVSVALFFWRKIFKQFKKDRTKLGFGRDSNGFYIGLAILSEALITFASLAGYF
ncbi:hypothetical protein COB55_01955 [Candidatus Wolfebacteria bacterium]|nr:MAG: hypothetical protein COB55_01955 [Candidatus Wolfebacteria bacterium]